MKVKGLNHLHRKATRCNGCKYTIFSSKFYKMDHLDFKATPKLTLKRKWVLTNWKLPGTMRMVDARTERNPGGVRVFNTTICGMMDFFRDNGLVERVKWDFCKESNKKATYWQLTKKGKSNIV